MQQEFEHALECKSAENKIKKAIKTLNRKRKERIFLLLKYIKDQGELLTCKILEGRVSGKQTILVACETFSFENSVSGTNVLHIPR